MFSILFESQPFPILTEATVAQAYCQLAFQTLPFREYVAVFYWGYFWYKLVHMACTIRTRYTELRLHVINVSPYRVNHMFNLIFMWFFVACLKYVLWVCQGHRRSPQIYTSCFSTPPPFAPCDCCAPGRKGRKSCCLKASNFNINFQAKKQWKVNIQFISVGRPTWVVNWILEAGGCGRGWVHI